MVHILTKNPSIANQFLKELRDAHIQQDRMRFRRNMERIGEIFAYEISKTLTYENETVETPLGIAEVSTPQDNLVLVAILRAGLPLHNGLLNYFDRANNAFISAYRVHNMDKGSFDISIEYLTSPQLEGTITIIADPMMATGSSMEKTLNRLLQIGTPKQIHVVTAIASEGGLNHILRLFPQAHIWVGDVDDELTAKALIVPGLGDAGDLSFGDKIQE